MLPQYAIAVAVLADDSGGESKKAGPIALVVILLLAISCYFLFRSMTKHLRRVRDNFPDDAPAAASPSTPPPENGQVTLQENGPSEPQPPPG
jgi:hypothetical protein